MLPRPANLNLKRFKEFQIPLTPSWLAAQSVHPRMVCVCSDDIVARHHVSKHVKYGRCDHRLKLFIWLYFSVTWPEAAMLDRTEVDMQKGKRNKQTAPSIIGNFR